VLNRGRPVIISTENVLISGFGKFCVKEKRERRGRNLATGEKMMLRPRKVVSFNALVIELTVTNWYDFLRKKGN
jgi:hypothetical protein